MSTKVLLLSILFIGSTASAQTNVNLTDLIYIPAQGSIVGSTGYSTTEARGNAEINGVKMGINSQSQLLTQFLGYSIVEGLVVGVVAPYSTKSVHDFSLGPLEDHNNNDNGFDGTALRVNGMFALPNVNGRIGLTLQYAPADWSDSDSNDLDLEVAFAQEIGQYSWMVGGSYSQTGENDASKSFSVLSLNLTGQYRANNGFYIRPNFSFADVENQEFKNIDLVIGNSSVFGYGVHVGSEIIPSKLAWQFGYQGTSSDMKVSIASFSGSGPLTSGTFSASLTYLFDIATN